jgi:putative oxidoreductase
MDTALLILRLVVGLYLTAHGSQKLLGWFGGGGLSGTQGFLGGMLGFRPAWLWTLAVTLAELGGGLLLALGLLGPIGPIGVAAAMVVIIVVAHWAKGPFNSAGGYELPLTNLAVAVAVAFAGPGAYSLDSLFGIVVPTIVTQIVVVLSVIGVLAAIATRNAPATQRQAQPKAA